MFETRTDVDGSWESDDGVAWRLVDPSPAWQDARAAEVVDPAPVAVPPPDAEIEAARTALAAATTVAQTKTRALALDDLRAAQIAAITLT